MATALKDDENTAYLEESKALFLEWASANTVSLVDGKEDDADALEKAISSVLREDVRVVALTEGCHNSKEMMQLHHRLVCHLVEYHNFTTIVTESGLPESKLVHDYILGEIDEDEASFASSSVVSKEQMYQKGLNRMYSEWEEGRALIEWMRDYNRNMTTRSTSNNGSNDKINRQSSSLLHYYGVDIGGFYNDWKTPLNEILSYIKRNVFTPDKAFRILKLVKQFQPFLDAMEENARLQYTNHMTPQNRSKLAMLFDETLEIFQTMESDFVQTSGRTAYEWARQSLLSMQLAENYYRNYMERTQPNVKSNASGKGTSVVCKSVGLNGREIAMHQNILWVLQQRPDSKVIWINHAVHTKTETQYQGDLWGFFTPTGAMLRESLGGKALFAIGLVYGGGHYWKDWQKGPEKRSVASVPAPAVDGLEATLRSLATEKTKSFFVPWMEAPVGAWPWLQSISCIRENDYYLKIKPWEWQACLYINETSPATPARGED